MKNIDEQLDEIVRRSGIVREKKECMRKITYNVLGVAFCLLLVIVTSIYVPEAHRTFTESGMSDYGSLIITSPYMGYVIIGFLAFLLGIFATLLCKRIMELRALERIEKK